MKFFFTDTNWWSHFSQEIQNTYKLIFFQPFISILFWKWNITFLYRVETWMSIYLIQTCQDMRIKIVSLLIFLFQSLICFLHFGMFAQKPVKTERPIVHPLLMKDKIAYYGALSNSSDHVNITVTNSGACEVWIFIYLLSSIFPLLLLLFCT